MSKRRFPDSVTAQIDSEIRAAAFLLRAEKQVAAAAEHRENCEGVQNSEIVARIVDKADALLSRHHKQATEHYLSTRIPQVLEGSTAERRLSLPILPGLDLAEWFAVPPGDHVGTDQWKMPLDCSPNELKRIIARRKERLEKERQELGKIRILRATAIERKCKPDAPISTVFKR